MKKNQLWLGVCVVILCLGILGGLWVMRVQSDPSVRIVQNGAVLYRFDLSSAEDQTFTVEYEGRSNMEQSEFWKRTVPTRPVFIWDGWIPLLPLSACPIDWL